ncbi:hypothetical protein GOM49_08175 [Clostridium bovifaecis]|uniref:BIG2 domain-containing protein n=1 Tax=Clostridium bovifaecis TaxID=2184719 RepID=A0A6I6ES63_9CLOT|nr:hypothetical protein GOM49_08175 [Clostridium bovifaecis]
MYNKKKLFNRLLIQLMVLALIFTPSIALAIDVIIIDPTPDTTPPVLTSLSISSDQASPGNPVKVTVEVSDELSGVNSVYICYRKPSGNSTGTFLYLNQTTQKYEGTINIGNYDEAGEWVLSYLTLTDKKDNSGYVYDVNSTYSGQKFDFSPYKFTVSGVSIPPITPEPTDKIPPVLNSITISTSQVSGPDTVKLIADVSDDDTGVYSVSANYSKLSGRFYSLSLYFNSSTGKYEGNITIDQYDEIGDWKLNSIYLKDRAGNYKYIYDSTLNPSSSEKQDFSNCKIYVKGITPDSIAPLLKDLSINLFQSTNNTATIKLTATISDDLSGVSTSYVYGIYAKPSGKTMTVRFNLNGTTGKYESSIPIDRYDELGEWKLLYIHAEDKKGNSRTINGSLIETWQNTSTEWNFRPYYFNVMGVIVVPPAVPSSVELSPKAITMNPGETQPLKVKLNMSDGTSKDVTVISSGTEYTSSSEEISIDANGQVTVSPNAKPGTITIGVRNRNLYDDCKITIPGAEKESYIIVNPLSVTLSPGQNTKLNIVAKLVNDTTNNVITNDVTDDVETTYTSDNTSLVNVTNKGVISIPAEAKSGSTKILINYKGITAETTVTVTGPPTIKAISMTPAIADINFGRRFQLSVWATMSDGTTKDVTNGSTGTTYTTSDSKRATVDADGLVSIGEEAISGKVTIKAINNNQIAQSVITINGIPVLTGIQVIPDTLTMKPGASENLKVMGVYSDGSTKDITNSSNGTRYTSGYGSRATVNADGLVTIPANATEGGVAITVQSNGFTAKAVLTVQKDQSNVIKSIAVTPVSATLKAGETEQLTVIATMGDGSTKDITNSSNGTRYTSGYGSRATVNADGLVTIPANATEGGVAITVQSNGFTAKAVLTVQKDQSNVIKSIAVTPVSATLKAGETEQLTVIATMGDGSTKDITNSSNGTRYTSGYGSRATVNADGLVTIPANATEGGVAITVQSNGFTAKAVLTVQKDQSNVIKSIAVTPVSATLKAGETEQLTVIATMGDGSTKDITNSSNGTRYTSGYGSRATVNADGLVTIPANATEGGVAITVQSNGFTAKAVLTVQKDQSNVIKSIAVTPVSATLKAGETEQLTVIATMGDGSTKDITNSSNGTRYTSGYGSRATVNADGLVTIPANATEGGVAITVQSNGFTAKAVLTVQKDQSNVIKSIAVTPVSATLKAGETEQLTVIATMGDGSTKDITNSSNGTRYTSGYGSRATVNADGLVTIPANATEGGVAITVQSNGFTAKAVLTVQKDQSNVIKSIAVTPVSATLKAGETEQLTVIATMGDGSAKDITNSSNGTRYTSGYGSRATVNADGLVTIPANATEGSVIITIQYLGYTIRCPITIAN